MNGDLTITTANAVVDAKDINGCVVVNAPGVTISRSRIRCAGFAGVYRSDTGAQVARLTVVDSEIDCLGGLGRTAVGEANYTALRVNVHGCENGFDVNQYVTVQDSYIHDLVNQEPAHSDGIQLAHYLNGCPTTACEVNHARNVVVEHNTIQADNGTSAMISNPSGDENVTIKNNLISGGAYTLYCPYNGTGGPGYQVLDNRVSRRSYPNGGAFGPWTGCEDEAVVSGNVWADTGLPL